MTEPPDVSRSRTFLFVPGDKPGRFSRAAASGADAIVIDLEDAVLPAHRAAARRHIVDWLDSLPAGPTRPTITVRVNEARSTDLAHDLHALQEAPHLDALVVPKFGDPASLEACASMTQSIIGIVESGAGLLGISSIGRLPQQVVRLSFGAGDFAADTGAVWEPDNPALHLARCQVSWASAAHSLPGPIDTAFPWLADQDGLRREALLARGAGYRGKYCIHPDQVPLVASSMGPSGVDVDWAQRVLLLWEGDGGADSSGALRLDNALIDEAVVKKAHAILAEADDSTRSEIPTAAPEDPPRSNRTP